MELKQKTKNYFFNIKTKLSNLKTNQTVLLCTFFAIAYLLSGYCRWLEIAVSLCAIAFMTILPLQKAFCVFMFSHSFTLSNIGYDSCYMVTMIGFCLILLVKYIIGLKKRKYKLYKKIVISMTCFIAISVAISLFHPMYRGAFLYFPIFALFYLIFAMRKEFSISQGLNYMFGGLLVSCATAALSLLFPHYQYEVIVNGRFSAFFNCTNYLYMRAMFLLAYYMYRYLHKDISGWKFTIIYLLCALITLTTISKTGIAMLALFSLIFFVLFLKQDFKKRIKYAGIMFVLGVVLCVVCHKLIISVFERFAESLTAKNFWNSILTGRDIIWKMYLEAIFKKPFNALFGHGLLREQIYIESIFGPTETHNFYIFLLYRFGIIGTIAFGYIVYLFIKELGYSKPAFIAWLPMLFILLESLCDNTHRCYNFTYFIFAIMVLFMSQKDEQIEAQKAKELEAQKAKEQPPVQQKKKKDDTSKIKAEP